MTIRSQMQRAMARVIRVHGRIWYYRKLTSGSSVDPRLYTAWAAIVAHDTGGTSDESFDEPRSSHSLKIKARFRVAESDAVLTNGDQVSDDVEGDPLLIKVWAVTGIESSSVGTVAYTIERMLPLRVEPNRQGGV